jgi:hypothetical protein
MGSGVRVPRRLLAKPHGQAHFGASGPASSSPCSRPLRSARRPELPGDQDEPVGRPGGRDSRSPMAATGNTPSVVLGTPEQGRRSALMWVSPRSRRAHRCLPTGCRAQVVAARALKPPVPGRSELRGPTLRRRLSVIPAQSGSAGAPTESRDGVPASPIERRSLAVKLRDLSAILAGLTHPRTAGGIPTRLSRGFSPLVG